VLREQCGHHSGRDVYVLNGIEVGKMRDDTCSPRVIVHVSLVNRLLKNSRACHWVVATLSCSHPWLFIPCNLDSEIHFQKMNLTQNVVSAVCHCNDGLFIAQGEDTKGNKVPGGVEQYCGDRCAGIKGGGALSLCTLSILPICTSLFFTR